MTNLLNPSKNRSLLVLLKVVLLKTGLAVPLLWVGCALAQVQTVTPKDGLPVHIELPAKGLTLIKFEYGKVLRIRHNAEEVLVEADADKGEAYIKVLRPSAKGVISFYVINDKYTIPFIAKINAKMPPAGSIVIQNAPPAVPIPPALPVPAPAPELSASHHARQIKETLIAVMGAKPVGFAVTEQQKDLSYKNGIRIVHERTYRNTLHTVEQYAFHNLAAGDLDLQESQFYSANVIAVSVPYTKLQSGQMTPVYVVKATR